MIQHSIPSPYDLSCWWDVKHKHNNKYNIIEWLSVVEVYDLRSALIKKSRVTQAFRTFFPELMERLFIENTTKTLIRPEGCPN